MKACSSRYCRCLYFSSNALARKMEKLAQESWKPVGLSPSHGYVLLLVIEHPGIQPNELVEQLLLTPSTITRLVEKLETRKLVTREVEGKHTYVHPTARAQQLLPQLKQSVKQFADAYQLALGREESSRLADLMNRMNDQLG